MEAVKIDLTEAARSITLKVKITGQRQFRFRLAIGAAIIRFAQWIIGAAGEVEIEIR